MEGNSRKVALVIMGILTLILAIVAVIIGLRLQEGVGPDDSSASVVVCSCGISAEQALCPSVCASTTARSTSVSPTTVTPTTARSTSVSPTTVTPTTARSTSVSPTTVTPTTSNGCPAANTVWCTTWNCPFGDTSGDGQCTSADAGAGYTAQSGSGCGLPPSGCGQRDYYNAGPIEQNWGAYYCHDFLNFDGCGGGPTTVTPTTVTPTTVTPTTVTPTTVTPTTVTPTTVNPPVCGNGIPETGEQCGEPGRSCPAGYTCNNATCGCVKAPAACGNGLAEAGEECGEPGLSCPTGSTCNSCACTADPQCGLACGSSGTCPVGHSCDAGTCKLNYCLQNAGNCSDGSCNPIACGEQCAPGGLCPNGHSCQSNICVANVCLNGGCSDKCTLDVIPRTALISDDVDRALLALLVIVLGYLMLRFKLVDSLWLETRQRLNLSVNKTEKADAPMHKKHVDFEDNFD